MTAPVMFVLAIPEKVTALTDKAIVRNTDVNVSFFILNHLGAGYYYPKCSHVVLAHQI